MKYITTKQGNLLIVQYYNDENISDSDEIISDSDEIIDSDSDLESYFKSLPSTFVFIKINFISPILSKLPIFITKLEFDHHFNDQIVLKNTFPIHLETLAFGDKFNKIIQPNTLPTNLKSLTFGYEFNQVIRPNTLPTNLKSLTFGHRFNQIVQPYAIPTNLKSLTFGYKFNKIIQPNRLPTNLQSLTFGDEFSQIVNPNTLPINLKSLVFGQEFTKFISVNQLPTSLKSLTINNSEYPFLLKSDERLSIEIPNRKWNPTDILTINSKRYHKLESFDNGINQFYLVACEQSHQLMICKMICYQQFNKNSYDRMHFERETMILLKGYHNFAQIIDYYDDDVNHIFYLFIEYCPKGDLHKLLINKVNKEYYFPEETIWNYISQLFSILKTLEQMKIVHCDIKPSNIFIGDDDRLILGDFGCCKELYEEILSNFTLPSIGTEGNLAPEIEVISSPYKLSTDIYSVGATILRLLSCHKDDIYNFDKFIQDRDIIIISPERYSPKLINFVKELLATKRDDRQSLQLILDNDQNHEKYIYRLSTIIKKNQFPNNITDLELEIYNEPITSSILPTNIKTLKLGINFNNKIDISQSNTLEILIFGDEFNQIIQTNTLPTNLQSLTFGFRFNQIIQPNTLPINLKSLTFGSRFNQIIQPNTLPTNLQSLTFGDKFNQIIQPNTLPTNLKSLTFGNEFNQIIQTNILPTNLESLTFGYRFNQIIEPNSLPKKLQSLTFGNEFNQKIQENTLPTNLKSLTFGYGFKIEIQTNTLPTNLQSLTFGYEFNQIILRNTLPTNLKSLTFGDEFNQIIQTNTLPTNLQSLAFGFRFNQIIQPNTIPTNLKSLTFGRSFNLIIQSNILPTNLRSLTFGNEFNQIIQPNTLPTNLESLTFGKEFNQLIELNTLPTNLKSLTFSFEFNQIILPNTLPTNLESLTFGYSFNQIIQANTLPTNLKSLTFGYKFNQIIQTNTLPTNLKSLVFGQEFTKFISVNQLPTSLKSLTINNTEYPFLLESDDERLSIEIPNRKWNPTDILTINSKRYHKLKTFDNGANQVYLVACEQSHQLMICKEIEKLYGSDKMYFERDSMISLRRYHNFVQLIEYYNDEQKHIYYYFIEYCPKGDLYQLFYNLTIKSYSYFSEEMIWNYISQLFSILETLEQMKIVHCDIKPSNIFIGDDDRLILGDFGCCTKLDDDITWEDIKKSIDECKNQPKDQTIGSEGYMPPEVTTNIPYHPSIDIFSFGSTILRLLSCHKDDINNFNKFIQDINNIIISPERYSPKLIEFVKSLVVAKREDRQSLQMILDKDQKHEKYIYKLSKTIKENQFPNHITELELDIYNEPITSSILPKNIKSLKIGNIFNINIDISQSNTLEILIFGKSFNQIIQTNTLPTNLKSLTFGGEFNQIIQSNTLPTNLQSLTFGKSFTQIIQSNTLPTNLQSLTFGSEFNQIIQSNTLPTNLQSLTFGFRYNQIIQSNTLPTNLQSLTFGYEFNQIIQLNTLPTNLQSLTFGFRFNQIIQTNTLLTNLQSLTFGGEFNQIIQSNILPTNLQYLTFGSSFNQIIQPNSLPKSIESLTFGFEFNQIIQSNRLPTNLESLTFGYKFNQIIQEIILPTNLKSLVFGQEFTKFISVNQLPTSLKSLKINNPEYPFLLKSDDERISIEILTQKWNPTDILTINSKRYHKLESFDNGINQVYLVICEQSHQLIICKVIEYKYFEEKNLDRMYCESYTMKLLKGYHNFAQLIDYYNDLENHRFYLFIEYYPKGDLHKLLNEKANETYLPEETIWNYISQLFSMLAILEQMKIVHCDIKPANIFIGDDDRLILGDFGCCTELNDEIIDWYDIILDEMFVDESFNQPYICSIGTEGYIAPEIKEKLPYSSAIDIYSVGSTILRLLSCHKDDIDNHDKFIQDRNNIIISPERYSPKLIDFVKSLLVNKREDRESLQPFQMILDKHKNENILSNEVQLLQ